MINSQYDGITHQGRHLLLPLSLQVVDGARCLDEDLGLPKADQTLQVVVNYHPLRGLLGSSLIFGPGLIPDHLVPEHGEWRMENGEWRMENEDRSRLVAEQYAWRMETDVGLEMSFRDVKNAPSLPHLFMKRS